MRLWRKKASAGDARTEVLARIRAALDGDGADGRAISPDGARSPGQAVAVHADPATAIERPRVPEPARGYRTSGDLAAGSPELLALLMDRLLDCRAVVHEVASPADLPATLRRVLADARTAVVPPWLDSTWVAAAAGAGVRVLTDAPTVPLRAHALESVDVVITGARVAVAETGTIVLDGAGNQGRRLITLLPDRHVCIVRADQVVQTVPEAIDVLGLAPGRPQTWISGPSATSDIELTRVEGVHGPRGLDVVLLRT